MNPTVRAALAVTAIALVPGPAAAMEEKSTKPRLAVLEFSNKAEAQLQVNSVQWGEWIADVERPQAAGSWAKADGLGVSWGAPESQGSAGRANDRLRNAGPKDGWPAAGRGIDIARVDGEIVAPSSRAGKQPTTRPLVLAPGGTRPRPAASGQIGDPEDMNIGVGELQEGPGGDPDRPVIAGSLPNPRDPASGQATGKRQHMPIRTRTYYDAPLQRGSVTLRLAQPWAGCAVGDRFNGIYLTTGVTHKYRLDGAEVASCGGSTVTINYVKFAPAGEPAR